MKNYSNYRDQVSDNLEDLVPCNNLNEIDEFYWENLSDAIKEAISDSDIIADEELPEDTDTTSEAFNELRQSYADSMLESLYQLFKVTLKGGEYTKEHARLMVFWNEEVNSWILPVFHFGTNWSLIGAV